MPEITRALIRKRSEHNEGIISTLEELTLHQEEIESINEVLGATCRHLKILYLQNNLISKLQNLNHLKELEYVNLALNNIEKIEGFTQCEHLKKLDFTANFIDVDELEASMDHLAARDRLKDLYMMGNPAQADWPDFQAYVIAKLPQLVTIDGVEVTRSMQIQGRQQLPRMEADLRRLAAACRVKKAARKRKMAEEAAAAGTSSSSSAASGSSNMIGSMGNGGGIEPDDMDAIVEEREKLTDNTPEARVEIYREIAAQKAEKEERENANKPKERNYEEEHKALLAEVREKEEKMGEAEIRQKNEPGVDFFWDEEIHRDYIALHVHLPKHLDSSLIDVDVHPTYVSIIIKTKLLRLKLPTEVKSSEAKCNRSKLTGELVVKMPKVNPKETSIFVNVNKQKDIKSGDGATSSVKPAVINGSIKKSSSSGAGSTSNSIKMPAYGAGKAGAELAPVIDCADDGSFDISSSDAVNEAADQLAGSSIAAGSTTAATTRGSSAPTATKSRTTVRKPKKLSLQEEMLLAAEASAAAAEASASATATPAHCPGISVVGESSK